MRLMKRVALVLTTFLMVVSAAQSASAQPTAALTIPAWTTITTPTRYPATGTIDVSGSYLGGYVGLQPYVNVAFGTLTLFWTFDSAGTQIATVQGISLASMIESTNQLNLPRLAPHLYFTYTPTYGESHVAALLYGTSVGSVLPEIPGDTILIEEERQPLTAAGYKTVYPCDYWAGEMRAYLVAPAGTIATLYEVNLTGQWRPSDVIKAGESKTMVAPMGAWFFFVQGAPNATYTFTVTPLVVPPVRMTGTQH